jgi:demethylmenaquinone methyltransferase/2-methoxy-6-polyprenyl-1,4-benzoquinol methylase
VYGSDDIARFYAELGDDYDRVAGYTEAEAEKLRAPIKGRYRELFEGRDVLEIACGTGYWTNAIAPTARSILATDINPSLIAQARNRCSGLPNVRFVVADAYVLDGINGGFNAAFAHWWWSHIPKSRVGEFLSALHSRLSPDAFVLIADQLLYDRPDRRLDSGGNLLETRALPDGRTFEIVKNFPTADELGRIFDGIAEEFSYTERPREGNWELTYTLRRGAGR